VTAESQLFAQRRVPWPSYTKLLAVPSCECHLAEREQVAGKIAATTSHIGLDPRAVITYEEENANRPEVIAALRALLDEGQAA
jgi:hypothetical protein